jgi:hypothetical protein
MIGNTHVIHGVCHAVSSAKKFCMSSSVSNRVGPVHFRRPLLQSVQRAGLHTRVDR